MSEDLHNYEPQRSLLQNEFNFEQENGQKNSIIKVLGVGGGGSNAVAYMYNQGITGVDFAVCNTDIQALDNNPVPVKIQLGPSLTEGRGAGSKPEVGKQSCIESIEDVRTFLSDGTKMLFITAGMGGGTGTGAAPIIAKAAREMGILTVGIITIPFGFEGRRRHRFALEGLDQMKNNVDSILVISNDKLRDIYGNLKLQEAFGKADNVLTTAAKGIAEIITIHGQINVDFEDVNTVMRDSGVCIMGTGVASGENRAMKAIDLAINSPLLEENDIRGAQHILLNISSGIEEVTMDEIGAITDYIQDEAGHGTDIIWGNCHDERLGESLSLTIIATGFKKEEKKAEAIAQPKVLVPLNEPFDIENRPFELEDESPAVMAVKENVNTSNTINLNSNNVSLAHNEEITNEYFSQSEEPFVKSAPKAVETVTDKKKEIARKEYLKNLITKPLESTKDITDMESEPAFRRRKVHLEDIGSSVESRLSRLSVSMEDDDQPIVERGNSFLHDNVD